MNNRKYSIGQMFLGWLPGQPGFALTFMSMILAGAAWLVYLNFLHFYLGALVFSAAAVVLSIQAFRLRNLNFLSIVIFAFSVFCVFPVYRDFGIYVNDIWHSSDYDCSLPEAFLISLFNLRQLWILNQQMLY